MAFEVLLNAKADDYVTVCMGTRQRAAYAQLSLLSILYVTHVINYSRPSTRFSIL